MQLSLIAKAMPTLLAAARWATPKASLTKISANPAQ
jgi:hypothetical protein